METLEDQNKTLQKHNIKLEDQLERATNANKNLEREKDMILKYSMTLEKPCLIYEAQIADAKVSLLSPFFFLLLHIIISNLTLPMTF